MNYNEILSNFDFKLNEIKTKFNYEIENLRNEYKDILQKNFDSYDKYELINDIEINKIKSKYKIKTKHLYYSYSCLVDNFLYANSKKSIKSKTRWFTEICVNYPNKVNEFIYIHRSELCSNYEKILFKLNFKKIF